jgi:hypothetical protein
MTRAGVVVRAVGAAGGGCGCRTCGGGCCSAGGTGLGFHAAATARAGRAVLALISAAVAVPSSPLFPPLSEIGLNQHERLQISMPRSVPVAIVVARRFSRRRKPKKSALPRPPPPSPPHTPTRSCARRPDRSQTDALLPLRSTARARPLLVSLGEISPSRHARKGAFIVAARILCRRSTHPAVWTGRSPEQ